MFAKTFLASCFLLSALAAQVTITTMPQPDWWRASTCSLTPNNVPKEQYPLSGTVTFTHLDGSTTVHNFTIKFHRGSASVPVPKDAASATIAVAGATKTVNCVPRR